MKPEVKRQFLLIDGPFKHWTDEHLREFIQELEDRTEFSEARSAIAAAKKILSDRGKAN